MEKKFSENDLKQIKLKEIAVESIEQQLRFFRTGIPKIKLLKSATKDDGIWVLDKEEKAFYVAVFDKKKQYFNIEKFIPASGAATRMFKFLAEFLFEFDIENETINAYINRKKSNDLPIFLIGIKNFPFYLELKKHTLSLYPEYESYNSDKKSYCLIKTLLSKDCFNYGNKPKGVLPFHEKEGEKVTPIEEHLKETIFYKRGDRKSKVHFTISEEHLVDFEKITSKYDDFDISFSYQQPYTDTLAVNLDNSPYRDEQGNLFFRPGGHGALIENLNALNSDIIFIKNIDNVSYNHIDDVLENKKILGGVLITIQNQVFDYLKEIEKETITIERIKEISDFITQKLNWNLPKEFFNFTQKEQLEKLFEILNRPIRVCGMVKNEGEPGGGPFWINHEDGRVSLQIVESSQIDLNDTNQMNIFRNSTHFNPVDLVCGIKKYNGEKFDLNEYVDKNTGFIVEKNKNGNPIKGFELPGLWNGAMAFWITIFVEVPLTTFNPVKTVNDLLKSAHQSKNE